MKEALYTDMDSAAATIEKYIFERKNVQVHIPRELHTEKDIELFEKALNIACAYFGAVIEKKDIWQIFRNAPV
jgi:hypothetical protein